MQTPSTHQPFDPESIAAITDDDAFRQRAAEMRAELAEQAQERTPRTGNPTASAQRAQQAQELAEVLHPLVEGGNDYLGHRYPGVEYTDAQLEFVSTIAGKIASKYIDISAERYGEEISLAMFLLATGTRKGIAIYQVEKARRQTEEPEHTNGRNEADRPDSVYRK